MLDIYLRCKQTPHHWLIITSDEGFLVSKIKEIKIALCFQVIRRNVTLLIRPKHIMIAVTLIYFTGSFHSRPHTYNTRAQLDLEELMMCG